MTTIEDRKKILRRVEIERKSKAILYVTGDRQGLETRIGPDIIDLFVDHLDAIGPVPRISLILYTQGGDTSTAWNLVNLIHMFCDEFELITPAKCRSAGTLISLGADRIVMTKQATLGPIDPSLQHPLGPQIPGASPDARAPVSVEAVNGFLEAFENNGKKLDPKILLDLSNKVHPLVLGQIFRSRQQIRTLAERLLKRVISDKKKITGIIDFLCSDSGSHDYTINRREAVTLGLDVEKASDKLYKMLRALHDSYSAQLELRTPFDLSSLSVPGQTQTYNFVRAVIESPKHGAHHFLTEGNIVSMQVPQPQPGPPTIPQTALQDNRTFEGWRKVA